MMIADILTAELDLADVLFLLGIIAALIAAALYAVTSPPAARWAPVVLSIAVGLISFGLMAL